MSFLLDTNVVSEWVKPRPDPGVVAWLNGIDEERVFISVVTLAELRHGVERMNAGRRRAQLDAWLNGELLVRFDGRVLPIDAATADVWGRIVARRGGKGRPIGMMDAFIAATAIVHGLQLVTRDVSDLADLAPGTVNPWSVQR